MLQLFSKIQPAFGLDISSGSFKLLQLESRKGAVSVKGYADAAMPKGLVVNDVISDGKTFGYLVKQAMEKPQFGKIDTARVVVGLPESKSFVRVIQIPVMGDKEAESAIPFEAESFIPLPVDQVYLGWQKLSVTGDKMNILIIASPREYVDKYLSILDQAGLKTVALEVESQSCQRSIVGKDSKDTVLIVDLQANRSSMIMIEEGGLQFTSTIPIAGSTFTESVAHSLGVSSAKAEEIKKKVGIANTTDYPNVKTAMLPVLNSLAAEIKNILKFHGEHSDKAVSKLLLAGGSAKLANLPEFLASQMGEYPGLQVELCNPWLNLPPIKNLPFSATDSLGYVTAIGLAMRGVNL